MIKLQAKTHGGSERARDLTRQGLSARMTNEATGQVIIDLPESAESSGKFRFPKEFHGQKLFMLLTEYGGGHETELCTGTVVCTTKGEKLRPYSQPSDKQGNGVHARFSCPFPVLTITADGNGAITVTRHQIRLDYASEEAWAEETEVYDGYEENLPKNLSHLRDAISAAVVKATRCPCHEALYIDTSSMPRPTTANKDRRSTRQASTSSRSRAAA